MTNIVSNGDSLAEGVTKPDHVRSTRIPGAHGLGTLATHNERDGMIAAYVDVGKEGNLILHRPGRDRDTEFPVVLPEGKCLYVPAGKCDYEGTDLIRGYCIAHYWQYHRQESDHLAGGYRGRDGKSKTETPCKTKDCEGFSFRYRDYCDPCYKKNWYEANAEHEREMNNARKLRAREKRASA
jgi:hypothetical protein